MKRLFLALLFGALAASPQASEPVTLVLTFGLNAEADERWDGSVEVNGGEIAGLERHQFTANDEIVGDNSWKLTNRRDETPPFARINYLEMSPAERPPVLHFPVSVFLTVRPQGDPRVSVKTAQGDFTFRVSEIGVTKSFLGGRASVALTATVQKLTTEEYEDDEAAIAKLPNGELAVAWVAYRDRADRVMVRTLSNGTLSDAEEITPRAGDLFRCSLAVDSDGNLWAFWSERDGTRWHIWGRQKKAGQWQSPVKISGEGTNTFHRAASSEDGHVFVVWQSSRGPAGQAQSDIYLRAFTNGSWSSEMQVSTSPANDWEPNVAGGKNGSAYIGWDSYDQGNYDIRFRAYEGGKLGSVHKVTSSPRFQAHASVAVDLDGRPWIAWDESGVNWGKDQGFLINPRLGIPLHQERSLRLAMWDGDEWKEPNEKLAEFYVYRLWPNFENPQIAFDGKGALTMVFRHWTRQRARSVGAKIGWENYFTRFDGRRWTQPVPLPHSRGSIEKRPALVRNNDGDVWAAWMTDNRTFSEMVPRNAEIYAAKLGQSSSSPAFGDAQLSTLREPFAEELPIHVAEAQNVKTIRDYTIQTGEKSYKIYRGDMHRHTDVSQDFKYDGSLIEVYRYALDAAAFDYIVPTDHQLGYDQEFTWWQDEKLTDLFHVAGTFTPMFGYERSITFPNGHRNVIFAKRGTRTLPIPQAEQRGEERAAKLYAYLHKNDGISMPHSSGTAQGTDWFDNDPEVEPLVEIFQGYRASYEYQGAPMAATSQKLYTQRSGFNALGYWWKALEKGYKIGVQASSDHWSTHTSYACIVAEEFTRDSMFQAIKQRHAYGATDNIVLDFQANSGGKQYIMGDIIIGSSAPELKIRAIGTDRIKQVVIVKNQSFVYIGHPDTQTVEFEFRDEDFEPGPNYYYVRVWQRDGQLAWSSPIWIEE